MQRAMSKYPWHFALAIAMLSLILFSIIPGPTLNEQRTSQQIPLTVREYVTLRRNFFFGHREMSDMLTGLGVVATTVDMVQNLKNPDSDKVKLRSRFEDSIEDLRHLSRWSIGMNDAYAFPAMYLLFDDERPDKALQVIELGINDERTSGQVPLLAAFITHIFMRDPKQAGKYYEILWKRHENVPEWVHTLANRLKTGDDPFDNSPPVRKYILSLMQKTFPRARAFFERHQKLYEEGRKAHEQPNSAGGEN